MAPLPASNTPRFWLDYSDGVNDHSLLFRYAASAGLATTMTFVNQFLENLATDLYLLTIIGARAAASGSNISSPVDWTGASTYGTGAMPAVSAPVEIDYVGRTTLGHMAKWFVYGWSAGVPAAYRFPVVDLTSLANTFLVLRAAVAAGTVIAIDGEKPSVYPYVNIQNNSYWETQARR
jgi:hypothetical protein